MRKLPLVALLLALCCRPAEAAPPGAAALGREALRRAPEVLMLLESLTRKDSAPAVQARLRATFGQQKLLVGQSEMDVTVEGSSTNWRGAVRVEMTLPCRASYSVDLAKIRSADVRWDARRKELSVKLPPVAVAAITPRFRDREVRRRFDVLRSPRLDGDVAREVEAALLDEDFEPEARRQAERQLGSMRKQARAELQDFLQRVLRAALPEARVRVE